MSRPLPRVLPTSEACAAEGGAILVSRATAAGNWSLPSAADDWHAAAATVGTTLAVAAAGLLRVAEVGGTAAAHVAVAPTSAGFAFADCLNPAEA